jgi:BNR repeat-like domain
MESGENMLKKILWPALIFVALGGWVFGYQYEFAQPSYDSGWLAFAPNEIKILTHNLGGDVSTYVVDLQFRDDGSNKVNQVYFGSRDADSVGTYWSNLTASTIRVDRCSSDVNCDEIRVRIWKIERANFDSGWKNISPGQTLDLTHSIGGSSDDYVVYLEFKDNEGYGIHQRLYGGSVFQPESSTPISVGAYWRNLNSSAVQVTRGTEDTTADQIRIRIWKASHPDYDSGWQAAGTESIFDHNLGGPWNDYVVDLQFKDLDSYGVNQRFYGGGPSAEEAGAYWKGLNGSQVSVYRQSSAPHIDQVRIRLWRSAAPKYDSGWFSLSQASYQTLTHNLGGNADDYVVDLEFKDSIFSINNRYYGGRMCYQGTDYAAYRGAYWYGLNNSQIRVYRGENDGMAGQVRVRIWLAPSADFDSGWRTLSAPGSMGFNPGLSNEDDCVVYLEFKNPSGAVHHMDYGGNKYWNASDVLYLYGAYWDNLSPTSIRFTRQQNDASVSQFRIRIWRNDPNPVPRYSWKNDWRSYEVVTPTVVTHSLGGNVDDYVLDMRFKTSGLIAENHLFYGSIYGKYDKSGAFYQNLNSSSLEVYRELNDGIAAQIMLRLWTTGYAPKTVFVSGHISSSGNPLSSVAVSFSGTGGGTCYTNPNGNYFMSLPYNYSGTATPFLPQYSFTPNHSDYGNLTANATTDYEATVPPRIAVNSPNGGESWAVGSAHNITWNSLGTLVNVKIEYSTNSGSSYSLIAASTPNDGTYPWTIPNTVSATCLVKVSDAGAPSLFDVSNAVFSIAPIADRRMSWTPGKSTNAAIAVEPSGKLHLVWEDDTPGNHEIYYKKSSDGGATWTANKRLTFNSGFSAGPTIIADPSGKLHLFWSDDTPGNSEIYCKRSTDGGATWTASQRLTFTTAMSMGPALLIDASLNLHLFYKDQTSGRFEFYYKKSTDGGVTWTTGKKITSASNCMLGMAIGIDSSGGLYLAWSDNPTGNYEVYYQKSTDGGSTWTASKRLSWNSGYSQCPLLAIDASDGLHIVWTDDIAGNNEIYYRKSTNKGGTWTATKRLTWNSGSSQVTDLAVDSSSRLHVIWMDDLPGNYEIYYRRSVDVGTTWTASQRLTWTLGFSGYASLGVDASGTIHVVWEDDSPGNSEIYYLKFK